MKKLIQHCSLFIIFLMMMISSYAQSFTMKQTLSDGAQRNTIAFDGLAFLTGNFCACSFIPPGKVADYFGFQYLRDNDITQMGHTTDFNTVIANNLLYVLDSTQKAKIIALAKAQVTIVNQYAYNRFPLIKAFVKVRDEVGNMGLIKDSVIAYSGELYKTDGVISIQRAKLYADIIKALTPTQKHYLDSVKVLGMKNMPVLPDQIDKRGLNNYQFIGTMSIAGDIFSWYVGNVDADVYFCPERQGNYFGGFYIKDAPAMGNHGYSIDTSLTQSGGINFLNFLNTTQRGQITGLVDTQRTALLNLVTKRTEISTLLRTLLQQSTIDSNQIISLSDTYGRLDGEISYYYAMAFAKVGWTLSTVQRDSINKLRNLDNYPCYGAYLYSDSIGEPTNIDITRFFLSTVPIRNIDFNVSQVNNTAHLQWTQPFVDNPAFYQIEYSNNCIDWAAVKSVAINSNSILYMFDEPLRTLGKNFYRIKVMLQDGSYYYSATRYIGMDAGKGKLSIYPNPTKTFIRLTFVLDNQSDVAIRVYNSFGQTVQQISRDHLNKGVQSMSIDLPRNIAAGSYWCTLSANNEHITTEKFIVQ